jgi:hypothetical protein
MRRLILSAVLAGGVIAGLGARATPLQRADVPADLQWVLHLDCDALRPTAVGQYFAAEMDKPESAAKYAGFQSIFNFDLRKQLHGLTLYGSGGHPEEGVLLVYADFEPDRLVTLAKAAEDCHSTSHGKQVIYNWIDDKKQPKDGVKPRIYAAIPNNRVVILGQREEAIARALDVLDQSVPNLAGSTNFAPLSTDAVTVLEAGALKLDLRAKDPNAALFRLSKMVRLQISETHEQFTGRLVLDAKDEEIAGHMGMIGQGLISLMKLQKENPQLLKLAEGLSLKQTGAAVVVTLAMPGNELVALMKADAARKAAKRSGAKGSK